MSSATSALRARITLAFGASLIIAAAAPSAMGQTRIYVKQGSLSGDDGDSWTTAYDRLQDALAEAGPIAAGGTSVDIWIASGTYRPDQDANNPSGSGDRTRAFEVRANVHLYGGFVGAETMLEQRNPDPRSNGTSLSGFIGDRSYNVVRCPQGGSRTLDGFLITGGNCDSPTPPFDGGGGIRATSSTLFLRNCRFISDTGRQGAAIYSEGAGIQIRDCEFAGNAATSEGGVIFAQGGSTLTVARCLIRDNFSQISSAGAIYLRDSAHLVATNCRFIANRTLATSGPDVGDGGAIQFRNASRGDLTNCEFLGNSAGQHGGAIDMRGGGSQIVTVFNCTFYGNDAGNSAGHAIHVGAGELNIRNSVLWNTPDRLTHTVYLSSGTVTLLYSNCQDFRNGAGPLPAGIGSFSVDPLFTDPDGADNMLATEDDDLRLQAGSSCIDAGRNSDVRADTLDLDGDGDTTERTPIALADASRFADGPASCERGDATGGPPEIVDIGAYEAPAGPDIGTGRIYVNAAAAGANDGSSWADAFVGLRDALDTSAGCANVAEIWVAEGTYMPDGGRIALGGPFVAGSGLRNATFQLRSGVAIIGGFRGMPGDEGLNNDTTRPLNGKTGQPMLASILSGDLAYDDGPGPFEDYPDNSRHVLLAINVTDCLLDGFTVRAGHIDLADFTGGIGAGMYIAGGSPTVRRVVFEQNLSYSPTEDLGGAGMGVAGANPVVANCLFRNNRAPYGSGVDLLLNVGGVFQDCEFIDNYALKDGGALQTQSVIGSASQFTRCRFAGNQAELEGGAINNYLSTSGFVDCVFENNTSGTNGGAANMEAGAATSFSGCMFYGNRANASQPGGGGALTVVNSSATLADCVFNGNTAPQGHGGAVFNEGSLLLVSACSFRANQAALLGGAIFNRATSSVSLRNCLLANNESTGRPGTGPQPGSAILNTNASIQLVNCTLTGNANGGGAALHNQANASSIVENCIIYGNSPLPSAQIQNDTNPAQTTATFSNIGGGWPGTGNIDADPLFVASVSGDFRPRSYSPCVDRGAPAFDPPPGETDLAGNPRVLDGDGAGGERVDIGAYEYSGLPFGGVIYVNQANVSSGFGTSWPTAIKELREALPAAGAFASVRGPVQVWVAAGTYKPHGPVAGPGDPGRTISFQVANDVAVYGGFNGTETAIEQRALDSAGRPTALSALSGDLNGNEPPDQNYDDNSIHVAIVPAGATTTLDGLVIERGNADGSQGIEPTEGGGLRVQLGGTATIDRCTFRLNRASYGGGAISQSGNGTVVRRTLFEQNQSDLVGGAVISDGGRFGLPNPYINCEFISNQTFAQGGAIQITQSVLSTIGCIFRGNRVIGPLGPGGGGAIDVRDRSALWAINSRFLANRVDLSTGGAIQTSEQSSASISNCDFIGNTAADGAALWFDLRFADVTIGTTKIVNGTFVDNRVSALGGAAVRTFRPSVTSCLVNSIFWLNRNSDGAVEGAGLLSAEGQLDVRYSTFYAWSGATPGPGNGGGDPLFVRLPNPGSDLSWGTTDDDYGDLTIRPGSSALDSGDSDAVLLDDFDLDADGDTAERIPLDLLGQPRFLDDPETPNTGPGAVPTYVDRGAREFRRTVCSSSAQLLSWWQPQSGFYGDPNNWNPACAPEAVDTILFDHRGNTFEVDFDDDLNSLSNPIRARRLIVRNGNVTIDLLRLPPPIGTPVSYLRYILTETSLPSIEIADDAASIAHLTIRDGTLEGVTARIASEIGASGEITVAGPNSRFDVPGITGDLEIGGDGVGRMNFLNGAKGLAAFSTIGNQPTAAGSRLTVAGAGSEWTSVFTMQVANGTLEVRDGGRVTTGFGTFVTAAGQIIGDGTIVGPVVNFGSVEPRSTSDLRGSTVAPGVLKVRGNYTQVGQSPQLGPSAGVLRVQIAGTELGNFDQLILQDPPNTVSTAVLGGGLIVEFANGFSIPESLVGIDLPVLTASLIGPRPKESTPSRFDVALFPAVSRGPDGRNRFMRVDYNGTTSRGGSAIALQLQALQADIGLFLDGTTVPGEPSAVAAGDLDGDGDDDLVIAIPGAVGTPGAVYIFWSNFDVNGDYDPTPVTQAITVGVEPAALAIGDFGGSASGLDIAVANAGTDAGSSSIAVITDPTPAGAAIEVITNGMNGAVIDEPRGLAVGDFDNSRGGAAAAVGDDLAVVNSGRGLANGNVQLLLRDDGARFAFRVPPPVPVGRTPRGIAPVNPTPLKDVNLDLAVANFGDGTLTLLQNNGAAVLSTIGTLTAGSGVFAVTVGDLHTGPNGRPELVAINGLDGTVSVFVNSPQPPAGALHPYLAAVNLPIGHPLPNGGSPQTGRLDPTSLALVSVDDNEGDADLDLVVIARENATANTRSTRLLRNDTVGADLALTVFGNVPNSGIAPIAVLAADIDNDGLDDVVTFNSTGFRADGGRGGTQPGIELQLKRDVPPAFSPGDLNCDGFVTVGDISAFVLALTNPTQYPITFPKCNVQLADTNGDGFVTVGDIASFVALLTGG